MEPLDKKTESWFYWRLFLIRVILYSGVTLGMAWQVSTTNVDLSDLSFTKKVTLVIGILVIWGNQMMAFFDQTMSRLAKGQLPLIGNGSGSGSTEIITKEQTK